MKEEVSCGQRFKYITAKLEHFWKRWRDEYLTWLREYHKCRSGSKESSLKKGDMVTVFGEGEKRGKWKLAVVEELIVGKDQRVREEQRLELQGRVNRSIVSVPYKNFTRWRLKLDRVVKGRRGTPL